MYIYIYTHIYTYMLSSLEVVGGRVFKIPRHLRSSSELVFLREC